jgi:hypothetical protein
MNYLVIYYLNTGAIQSCASWHDEGSENTGYLEVLVGPPELQRGHLFLEQAPDGETQWVEAGVIVDKTPFPLTVEGPVVSGLPANTLVEWPDGVTTTESDGAVELESNVIGSFSLTFWHASHITETVEVQYSG